MPNKKKKHIKEKKHILKRKKTWFIFLTVVLTIFGLVESGIFLYKNLNFLIYPQLHKDQVSPKQIIEEKNIPPNQTPVVIENGSRYQLKVALTFDADMTPAMKIMLDRGIVKSWYNKDIIKTLNKEQAKATIFFTGLWVETYPKEAQELATNPLFEIGNHSYSHPAFTKNCYKLPFIDDDKDGAEITQAQEAIKKVTNITPKYFRFPGGCYDQNDLKVSSQLGLKVIYWDIAAGDGFNKDVNSIIQTVESRVQNGSIIVFHLQGSSFAPETNEALVKIIPYLKKRGYQLVTISELLNEK